jgi:hypothetical protein
MMYDYIMSSLSEDPQKQGRNWAMFLIGGRGSGAVLLKVVITVSHVDTRATACKESSFSCFVVIWMALLSQHLLFDLFAAGIANTIKAVGIKSWGTKDSVKP